MKNRRGEDEKVSRTVWKAVETEAKKIGVVKTKTKREEAEEGERKEKTKERKSNRGKESSKRIRDLGWGGETSKIRKRGKKFGTRMIS